MFGSLRSARDVAGREWLILTALLTMLAAGLAMLPGLGRADLTLYDQFTQTSTRAARDDIVIIAIDDYSLAQLGRWPWPRSTHARLLEQLNTIPVSAVALDVILTEPELTGSIGSGTPDGDAQLAVAIRHNGRVVLPLALQSAGRGLQGVPPVPSLRDAAARLGHINLEQDQDGVVRSVFLEEGQTSWWPQLALAMTQVATQAAPATVAENKREERSGGDVPAAAQTEGTASWHRRNLMHIRFAGPAGQFHTIPYVTVLRGEVPADYLRNKYLLIGATADGLTDQYPTPMAGNGSMPGVEIHANILADLLEHTQIRMVPTLARIACACLVAWLTMVLYLSTRPRWALLGFIVLGVLVIVGSRLAFAFGWWLPPSASLIVLLCSYPLWSWRRLEAVVNYLTLEFRRLDREPHLLPEVETRHRHQPLQDLLGERMAAVEQAAHRVRDLRQFVSDSIDGLPDATLVCTVDGHVLLANRAAVQYFESSGNIKVQDALLPYLFAHMRSAQPIDAAATGGFNWWDLIDLDKQALYPHGIDVSDAQGRDLVIKSAPCRNAQQDLSGWLLSIVDISPIRAAERSREETLRFISHDMRAPQASILSLLELQRDPDAALPADEFYARIERASRTTLDLADNFVQLARAESQEYRFDDLDLQVALFDAVDEIWALAHKKKIEIVTDVPDEEFLVHGDRTLLTRALLNLLSNAVKYSPEHSRVTCRIERRPSIVAPDIACSIIDQGYGIAPADQARLFRRFQRIHNDQQPRQDGVGLGLVFVKTVVERHRGRIEFSSVAQQGTRFSIVLPQLQVL